MRGQLGLSTTPLVVMNLKTALSQKWIQVLPPTREQTMGPLPAVRVPAVRVVFYFAYSLEVRR